MEQQPQNQQPQYQQPQYQQPQYQQPQYQPPQYQQPQNYSTAPFPPQGYQLVAPPRGANLLKVPGIIMIVFGALGLIFSFIAIGLLVLLLDTIAMYQHNFSYDLSASGIANLLIISVVITIIYNVFQLTTGITSTAFNKKPEKSTICLVLAIIMLLLNLISTVVFPILIAYSDDRMSFIQMYGQESLMGLDSLNIFSLLTGSVLPVLAIIGAVLNKKSAETY